MRRAKVLTAQSFKLRGTLMSAVREEIRKCVFGD